MKSTVLKLGALGTLAFGGSLAIVRKEHYKSSIDKDVIYTTGNIKNRKQMLEDLKHNHFDVVIIGGGATGTSVALDFATRGIKCALLEANDFGSGTSSKSTKLLHGGVRYLESALLKLDFFELYFVWRALEERAHLLNSMPYANTPLAIVLPFYKKWQVPYFWFNIKVYELLARFVCLNQTGVPASYFTFKGKTLENFPQLREDGLLGSVVYYDGQHNDSRTNAMIAFTSAMQGYVPGQEASTIANHAKVTSYISNSSGQVVGVNVKDTISGEEFKVMGKVVVNCAGPFADKVREMGIKEHKSRMLHSRGTHIVVPKYFCPNEHGLFISKTTDGRVLFVIPWLNHALLGTTDNADDLAWNPEVKKADIDFIVNDASLMLNIDPEFLRKNIKSQWAGLRPLIAGVDAVNETGKLSRGHMIIVDPNGVINVLGGKWTISRLMAEECVDKALSVHKDKLEPKFKCRTKNIRLLDDLDPKYSLLATSLVRDFPELTYEQASHLVRSYGYNAKKVCSIGRNKGLLKPLSAKHPFLLAEIPYVVENEMACTVIDVLARRLRLAFLDSKEAISATQITADLMGQYLNWDDGMKRKNIFDATQYFGKMMGT
ncbi:glycerol-3-phosphate dehydrogenase [Babesia microti strain RI]|uniref:glycerol-3-phosphate dehydrogenase n=1 Tax=Babesia microti (strain RI) TaxID=1133968 RepID=I7I8Q0_BABMR|nr:glycerol-3-phosphate dehydrogenase [Babesia microti strain RI]CCF73473.1 glycerol-3-phosphate dehydrogenase [Babesia microti strain RI]|eukprot:XP_012648082.1 glycerol-3-phosphate dehydrogenase [Babesia microti strain RI]